MIWAIALVVMFVRLYEFRARVSREKQRFAEYQGPREHLGHIQTIIYTLGHTNAVYYCGCGAVWTNNIK